ncbi:MAG: CRISPR-associated endonuclease Cas2 [Thermoguttaceae bacterium]
MPRQIYTCSGYNSVWLVAMFDLPVKTKRDRRVYSRFRKMLLENGFTMLQFSVYARFCASEELAQKHRAEIRQSLPSHGHVRVMTLTERQFSKMENYVGKRWEPNEMPQPQLAFF